MTKFIVNPITGDYESTSYTFGDRFGLKDGGRIDFKAGTPFPITDEVLKKRWR